RHPDQLQCHLFGIGRGHDAFMHILGSRTIYRADRSQTGYPKLKIGPVRPSKLSQRRHPDICQADPFSKEMIQANHRTCAGAPEASARVSCRDTAKRARAGDSYRRRET
ncbi:MAG: hypothetical protein OSA47_09365, partial [Novosphingopyxis baekryungensis]|nr:hypothetical protein [Novosphingopyxis baekryungensis]